MSAETYILKDNFKQIFENLVVLNKNLLILESNHLNLRYSKSESRISEGLQHQADDFFLFKD